MNVPFLLAEGATETTAINWHSFFFLLFALISCGMALAVLFTNNIVRMAFYLTVSLGAVSGLFILAGAHFVGAMQLMIYVGGTLVLLIFGVMLTSQAQFIEMKTRGGEWILASIVGGSMLAILLAAAFKVDDWRAPTLKDDKDFIAATKEMPVEQDTTSIGAALMGLRNDSLSEENPQIRRGMSGYFLHFEIVSIHLLVVLIGAAYLARARHSVGDVIPPATLPPPADRRRSLVVSLLLFGDTVIALVATVGFFYVYTVGREAAFGELAIPDPEPWFWVAAGVLLLAVAFSLIAVLRWQQWGVCGLGVLTFLMAVLMYASGFDAIWSIGAFALGAAAIGILCGLLCIGGRRSVWAHME